MQSLPLLAVKEDSQLSPARPVCNWPEEMALHEMQAY